MTEVISSSLEMQRRSEVLRLGGHTIGLVPTMGFLHEGHLELMRVAKKHADTVVMSIFVNPIQFGPNEDYETYPRDTERDLAKADGVGVDIAFMPTVKEMYPEGSQTTVTVSKVTKHLCGLSRPGHFEGVATVVAKLFNIIKPHLAIFGQKDYQQLTVISRMVRDLNMDVQIIGVPTVREPDGLAMSSRNSYLSPHERNSALCLKKSLDLAGEIYRGGERDTKKIRTALRELILSHPLTEIDYISLSHSASLEEVDTLKGETLLALAVKVGRTRLIDNRILGKGIKWHKGPEEIHKD